MSRTFTLFFLLSGLISATAQTVRNPLTVPYTGLSAYSSQHTDAFAFTGNQAALAYTYHFTAGLYSERRFLLQELSVYQLAITLPVAPGSFGICGTYMGFSEQNESKVGLAYGRKLSRWLNAGVQFNYHTLHTAGYNNASTVSVEAAALIALSHQLHMGLQINNPSKAKIGREDIERLPMICSVGLGYEPSPTILLTATAEKAEKHPLNIKTGLQYRLNDRVAGRAGVETATTSLYMGVGIWLRNIRLDAAATLHPQLGFTPGLMLLYTPTEKP